jgi:hypothetical protein
MGVLAEDRITKTKKVEYPINKVARLKKMALSWRFLDLFRFKAHNNKPNINARVKKPVFEAAAITAITEKTMLVYNARLYHTVA